MGTPVQIKKIIEISAQISKKSRYVTLKKESNWEPPTFFKVGKKMFTIFLFKLLIEAKVIIIINNI